jgi:hypothetical protein
VATAADLKAVLAQLRRARARHRESIREQLAWDGARLDDVLSDLSRRRLVKLDGDEVTRRVPRLSGDARRIYQALPDSGARVSGAPLRVRLGMTTSAFRNGRAELKQKLLILTGPGRGGGTLQLLESPASRYEERVEGLRQELELECEIDPGAVVVHELFHACFIGPHEGSYPTYGAIVFSEQDWGKIEETLARHGLVLLPHGPSEQELQRFADGMNSFVIRAVADDSSRLAITHEFKGLERAAVELARQLQATVVQRSRAGVVRLVIQRSRSRLLRRFSRLVTGTEICIREGGLWTTKPIASDLLRDVIANVPDVKPHEKVGDALLSLCLHVLSPNHVGTTLVWFFNRDSVPRKGAHKVPHLGWQHAFTPPRLNPLNERHVPVLLHGISQLDRAALVSSEGDLLELGVNLEPPDDPALSVEGGTRHNSAALFSRSCQEAVVFVVSSDGPVTIFKDGYIVSSTRRGSK